MLKIFCRLIHPFALFEICSVMNHLWQQKGSPLKTADTGTQSTLNSAELNLIQRSASGVEVHVVLKICSPHPQRRGLV